MSLTEFILYLIYGFSMISMGLFAIMQKDNKIINLPFIKSMKYLGCFGIAHGISEWVSIIIKLQLCHPHYGVEVYNFNQILKAVSFALLLYFALDILPLRNKYKKIVLTVPAILLFLYISGFYFFIAKYGADYHQVNNTYNILTLRYSLGFFSSISSSIALYWNALIIGKTKSMEISKRYKSLAFIFLVYGILEGLLVPKAPFFPANLLNKEILPAYFSLASIFFKAIVGFVINYLLINVIDTFQWEQQEKLDLLEKLRIAAEERRKLGIEIHDSIIQGLFAAGLKIDYLSRSKDTTKNKNILEEVEGDLNDTIQKVRDFISSNALDKILCEDLNCNIQQLIQKLNQNQRIKIDFESRISPYTMGNYLLPEKSTQIYYIIQEALTNVIKHSEADHANVFLDCTHDNLYITVTDNGKGISPENLSSPEHYGISSMRERTQRVGGVFSIEKINNGTRIELKIPWEENNLGKENPSIYR